MKQIKKNYKRRGKIYIVVAFKEKHGFNQFNGNRKSASQNNICN